MAYDTPATIAILGAGPIGLEAALYARFLGYEVQLFEKGQVGDAMRRWGHVTLFSPFRMNRSPLAIAAIEAQDSTWQAPDDLALLSGAEYVEQYLQPLAATDLIAPGLRTATEVVAVGRAGSLKGCHVGDEQRSDAPFRILTRSEAEGEEVVQADVVIDTTGTYGQHNWLGQGGIPALGEAAAEDSIEYGLPDVLGRQRDHYAGREVLVVGGGYSAATTIVALAELAKQALGTRVVWVTRQETAASDAAPIRRFDDDLLRSRDRLAHDANQLAAEQGGPVQHREGSWVDHIEWSHEQRHRVHLQGRHQEVIEADRIVAQVGYRPNRQIYSELQVHECYASDGPMKLAAILSGQASGDCLNQVHGGSESLVTPEPNFYILGAKSYGRNSNFLIATGLDQIRELFSLIGDRSDLNLYANTATIS